MHITSISFAVANLAIRVLAGPDLAINFPGFLRTRADIGNLQVHFHSPYPIPSYPILIVPPLFSPFSTHNLSDISFIQTFTAALGAIPADPITSTTDPKRPFQVGEETFTDFRTAATRSCNLQHNKCAELANSKDGSNVDGIKVGDCDDQQSELLLVPPSDVFSNRLAFRSGEW